MTANAISSPTLKASAPLYQSLFVQVLVALLLGIVLGMAVPDFAVQLKLLSDGFLKLISMIVAPIVFCVVVHGMADGGPQEGRACRRQGPHLLRGHDNHRLGARNRARFRLRPRPRHEYKHPKLDAAAMNTHAANAHKLQGEGVGSFILNIIPTTSVDALAAQRRASGAVLRDHLWDQPRPGRRKG